MHCFLLALVTDSGLASPGCRPSSSRAPALSRPPLAFPFHGFACGEGGPDRYRNHGLSLLANRQVLAFVKALLNIKEGRRGAVMSLIAKAMAKASGGSSKTPTENVHELRTALASLADRSHPPDKVRCCSSSSQPRGPLDVPHRFAAARRRSVPPAPKRVLPLRRVRRDGV